MGKVNTSVNGCVHGINAGGVFVDVCLNISYVMGKMTAEIGRMNKTVVNTFILFLKLK